MANHSNLTVDTLVDELDGSVTDGDISLRDALAAVAPGGQITFASSLSNGTIPLSLGQLELAQDVTIDGSDTPGLTLSGNNAVRVFDLTGLGITVNLNDLEIANGRATNGTGEDQAGAGIRGTNDTTLNLENVTFTGNVAGFAGAIYTGFSSTNTIINSTFTNNQGTLAGSERGGGAIATRSNGSLTVIGSTFTGNRGINGGAINSLLGELTLEDSTFLNNDTQQGSGANTLGYGGAVYVDGANASGPGFSPGTEGGTVTIRNSEFRGNTGKGQGGGLFLFLYPADELLIEGSAIVENELLTGTGGDSLGGGIRLGNGTYTIRQTTIANNRAESQGGGLWVGESSPGTIVNSTFFGNQAINPNDNTRGLGGGLLFSTTSPQTLTNITIAQNQAGNEGGGIVGRSNVTLTNTIVANNTVNNPFGNKQNASDGQGFNASPPPYFSDGGGNLQWPEITNNFNDANITATVLQADPRLGTLQADENGVLIVPLQPGSAAIDAGVNNGAPSTDQRGQTRPVDGDENGSAIADIGAIEFAPQPTPVNNAPTDLSLSNDTIPENASSNSPIGTLSTTDPDPNDTFTYSLVTGAGDTDNVAFTIIGDELRLNPSPDFENQSSYNIRIQTTDAGGLSYAEAFTINITDVPEGNNPPTIPTDTDPTPNTVPENAPINTSVGITAQASDPDGDSLTYRLINDGNGLFQIDAQTGVITVAETLDYETATRYTLTVEASDSNNTRRNDFTVNLTNLNDNAPNLQDVNLSSNEGQTITFSPTPFLNAFSDDDDDSLQAINLVTLPTVGSLALNDDPITEARTLTTAQLNQLTYTPPNDFVGETTLTVTASDGDNNSETATVTFNFIAVNNPPTFTSPDNPDQTVTPGETVTIPNFVTDISPGSDDESQQPLSFILETEGDDIFLDPPTLDPNTGTLSYTLADQGGIATVRVTLTDESGGQETSEPTTFTITSIGEVEVALTTDNTDLAEALTYDTTPIPPSIEIATTLAQDVTTLGTEAAFDNLVGLYPVVGVEGGIDTDGDGNANFLPGDSGYARAAITNRVESFQILAGALGNPDFNTTTSEFGDVLLNGGRFYAPFVIAQGGDVGFEGFLANEDAETSEFNNAATFRQDLVAYFAFVGANPDGAKHLKNFGNGVFGFEDLPANLGISDNDFDDAVFQLAFEPLL